MKYTEVFKSGWFYGITLIYFSFSVLSNLRIYKNLYIAEYLGILLGSFISTIIIYSIGYGIVKIYKKVTKR